MPPKVLQKNDRASGVLPISASARAPNPPKQPAARLKLEIRRLPPSLTLTEFEQTLGEEWRLGAGKVDWREYRQGKLKSPGKLPEQSRCYVHLVNAALVKDFEQKFLSVVFQDKAGTHRHAELRQLPPTLGFAMNQRLSALGKQKADNRQGTIDQDPEYMAFLEAETQPIPRAAAIDSQSAVAEKKAEGEGVGKKSTPLIEDLRERKATKARNAAAKAAEKKGHVRVESKDVVVEKDGQGAKKEGKKEVAAKEAAKVLNKQVAAKGNAAATAASFPVTGNANSQKGAQSPAKGRRGATQQSPKPAVASPAQSPAPASPAAQRGPAQRQRGNTEGIKKMLQKDLGIRPKPAPAAASPAKNTLAQPSSTTSTPATASPKPTPPPAKAPFTPAKAPLTAAKAPLTPAKAPPIPAAQASSVSQTKAYLKHANPSQGMTEILIQQALAAFGEMFNVTIDPRKGTAIAVFKDQEGLKKAIEAKKVPVAQGAVEVLEFRERNAGGGANAGGGGGRGGRGGGRGGRAGRGVRSGGDAAAAPVATLPAKAS